MVREEAASRLEKGFVEQEEVGLREQDAGE